MHVVASIEPGRAPGLGMLLLATMAAPEVICRLTARPGSTMHTLTDHDLKRDPLHPFEGALRGESTLITVSGLAVMMALPLGANVSTSAILLDLAAQLYDSEQISLGRAAKVAGLSYSDMIDELGHRGIATIRLQPGELDGELAAFGP